MSSQGSTDTTEEQSANSTALSAAGDYESASYDLSAVSSLALPLPPELALTEMHGAAAESWLVHVIWLWHVVGRTRRFRLVNAHGLQLRRRRVCVWLWLQLGE